MKIARLLFLFLLMLTCSARSFAQTGTPTFKDKPTSVFRQRLWVDGSYWELSIVQLKTGNYGLTSTKKTDTARLGEITTSLTSSRISSGPSQLAGPSWGGFLIAQAPVHSKAINLIYMSE